MVNILSRDLWKMYSRKGPFNSYVDKMGVGGQFMFFVHAQGIKIVEGGGGDKKWQNSVHVVVE